MPAKADCYLIPLFPDGLPLKEKQISTYHLFSQFYCLTGAV